MSFRRMGGRMRGLSPREENKDAGKGKSWAVRLRRMSSPELSVTAAAPVHASGQHFM